MEAETEVAGEGATVGTEWGMARARAVAVQSVALVWAVAASMAQVRAAVAERVAQVGSTAGLAAANSALAAGCTPNEVARRPQEPVRLESHGKLEWR